MISISNRKLVGVWKLRLKNAGLLIVLLVTLVSGCSSVLSDSENFYKDMPRRRINWREYLTD